MVDLATFSKLVATIYEAGLDEANWAPLAQQVASTFSSESAVLQIQPLVSGGGAKFLSSTANLTANAQSDYERHYYQTDVYVRHAAAHGMGGVYLSQEAVAPSVVARSEFYTDWGSTTGVFHVVGGGVMVGQSSVAFLSVHRPMLAPTFDDADRTQLGLLLGHVGRALNMAGQIGAVRAVDKARGNALEHLAVGAIVVAGDGMILWCNAIADSLLRAADGLRSIAGRLGACRNDPGLQRMIRASGAWVISAKAPGGLLSIPRPGRAALSLLVGPLATRYPGAVRSGPAAIVFVHDPEIAECFNEAALSELYGLTPAEARLATAVGSGERLHDYAAQRGISLATVKTQLRQVLAKTGSERQVELAAKLARNSVLRMATPFR